MRSSLNWAVSLLPPANKVWGKVIFSEVCVKNSVHRGGGGSASPGTPRARQVHPPRTRQVPPRPGRYPPGPRQVTPPGQAGTPPGPGRYPPRDKAGTPPGPGRYTPPDQAGTLPGQGRYPPPEIRSMRGRYASYWNAILLK